MGGDKKAQNGQNRVGKRLCIMKLSIKNVEKLSDFVWKIACVTSSKDQRTRDSHDVCIFIFCELRSQDYEPKMRTRLIEKALNVESHRTFELFHTFVLMHPGRGSI